MDNQILDSYYNEHTPDVNNETLIVNELFGIADKENNSENTIAPPEFSHYINMEAEEVDEKIIDKLFNNSDQQVIKTIKAKNFNNIKDDKNGDCVQTIESNSFESHMICDASYDDDSNNDDQLINPDRENTIISVSSSIFSKNYVKTKGESDICDLPLIEDLKISVDGAKCQPVGCIISVIDTLVIVEAFLNQPALDIDSVLFVDLGKRAIGRIFDIFGPVIKPFYAIHFNDSNHIKKFNLQIKEPVYCAPQTEYATNVLVSELIKMKGSDASWRYNKEPPCELLDYSDNKAEKFVEEKRKQKKCTQPSDKDDDIVDKKISPDHPSQSIFRNNHKIKSMTSCSSIQNSNIRTQQTSPRPSNHFNHDRHGQRRFLTYAQHLNSMAYSYISRQPYNPWYNNPMYPQRHNYPHHQLYMSRRYTYQSQPPMDPNNQFNYPYHFD